MIWKWSANKIKTRAVMSSADNHHLYLVDPQQSSDPEEITCRFFLTIWLLCFWIQLLRLIWLQGKWSVSRLKSQVCNLFLLCPGRALLAENINAFTAIQKYMGLFKYFYSVTINLKVSLCYPNVLYSVWKVGACLAKWSALYNQIVVFFPPK